MTNCVGKGIDRVSATLTPTLTLLEVNRNIIDTLRGRPMIQPSTGDMVLSLVERTAAVFDQFPRFLEAANAVAKRKLQTGESKQKAASDGALDAMWGDMVKVVVGASGFMRRASEFLAVMASDPMLPTILQEDRTTGESGAAFTGAQDTSLAGTLFGCLSNCAAADLGAPILTSAAVVRMCNSGILAASFDFVMSATNPPVTRGDLAEKNMACLMELLYAIHMFILSPSTALEVVNDKEGIQDTRAIQEAMLEDGLMVRLGLCSHFLANAAEGDDDRLVNDSYNCARSTIVILTSFLNGPHKSEVCAFPHFSFSSICLRSRSFSTSRAWI